MSFVRYNDRLERIEKAIRALDGGDGEPLDVRLTGSNVEDENAIPVKQKDNVEQTLFERTTLTSDVIKFVKTPSFPIKGLVVYLTIYKVSGSFADGQGYSLNLKKQTSMVQQAYNICSSKKSDMSGNYSGAVFTVIPGIKENSIRDGRYQNVDDYPAPYIRYTAEISGTFGEGEGIECEGSLVWLT